MKIYKHYEQQDFSYLLHPQSTSDIQNCTKTETAPPKEYADKKHRTDLLSNQSMKYAYSKAERIYHDRSCGAIRYIPHNQFEMTKQFSDAYTWCSTCYRLAVIRCGIQNDGKLFERYVQFFKLVHADTQLLHLLIVENHAQLWIVSDNVMEFKVNADCWRVSKRDGNLVLLHNDYHIDNRGNRALEKSFHIQFQNAKSFRSCVNYMLQYSWQAHVAKYNATRQAEWSEEYRVEIYSTLLQNAFTENYFYVKNRYVFSEKLLFLDSAENTVKNTLLQSGLKIKFSEEHPTADSKYKWLVCKVRKKQLLLFTEVMRETAREMFSTENYEYFNILKKFKECRDIKTEHEITL